MIIEIGHYTLVLALAASIIVSIVPVVGARKRDLSLKDVAPRGSIVLFILVAFSFGVLTYAGLRRLAFGTALAHAGLGITVIGIVAVSTFATERMVKMRPGATVEAGGYAIEFQGMSDAAGPNFKDARGSFIVQEDGEDVAEVWSSKRVYNAHQMPTTEAGIETFGATYPWAILPMTVPSSSVFGGSLSSSASGLGQ